ncbi:MAG: metallophosphoesterase family protein [Bacteroidota bacterium]
MKKIGVISDTHGFLDEKVFKYFESCDEIWHAGDIGPLEITDQLSAFKPLKAVYGNIDDAKARKTFPLTTIFLCEEMKVMIHHIGGKPYSYPAEVKEKILTEKPDIFVCGHSHILRVEFDKKFNLLHINPGAAGVHGFHKVKTILRFCIDGKQVKNMEAVELGPRAGMK